MLAFMEDEDAANGGEEYPQLKQLYAINFPTATIAQSAEASVRMSHGLPSVGMEKLRSASWRKNSAPTMLFKSAYAYGSVSFNTWRWRSFAAVPRSTASVMRERIEKVIAETGGFEPPRGFYPPNSLARSRFRPLSHVSKSYFLCRTSIKNRWSRVCQSCLCSLLNVSTHSTHVSFCRKLIIVRRFCTAWRLVNAETFHNIFMRMSKNIFIDLHFLLKKCILYPYTRQ